MNTMENFAAKASQKLESERSAVKGQKELAMAGPVAAVIKDFCTQNEAFAKAVVEGGSFDKCMKTVAEGTGNYISDLDAYKKAVRFYLPDAKIQMQLSIDFAGDEANKALAGGGMVLSLEDFL